MKRALASLFVATIWAQAPSPELRQKYIALTEGWTKGVVFTKAEREAMERGRQWEQLMWDGLDDPVAKKILAAGEPSFAALDAHYPGKILDRTILGTYSDPSAKPTRFDNEFAIWWNGAISANLRPQAGYMTNGLFRVGKDAEMFGLDGERYTRIGYEDGYLPIVTAAYTHGGIRYREIAFADKPREETKGYDVAYVGFEIENTSGSAQSAELHEDIILIDGGRASASGQKILDPAGAVLLVHSDPRAQFDAERQRITHRLRLEPGQKASVFLKVPFAPDAATLVRPASQSDFEQAHRRVREFWTGLLSRGVRIETPEERVNNVWRALLLQNFILADGQRFTYGSGLLYNDSYYPVENGFGAHVFAMYGFPDYANALLPYCVPVSVNLAQAARKYQNRRGLPLRHVFENYRLTRKTDVFERNKADLYRVAEEIIRDRRSTMVEQDGSKPLHWGLLPADRPGVDLRASTQTVHVPAHNITSCQGLQDFGQFLVRSGIDPERGRRYLAEAKEYRQTILEAMERSAIRLPGRPPFVDLQTLYFRETPDYGPEPYDHLALGRLQGTYYHYWEDMQLRFNFFNPSDTVGQWIADYVADRGGFVLGCTRARPRPESPYGWINNVYNAGHYEYRLRGGRRDEFLVGFYSRLAFGMSRHVYVASEGSPFIRYNTRNGGFVGADYSFPNSAANAETLSLLRFMLVLEELKDNVETGDIYLMKGVPRAWLENGKKIQVTKAPTYFGALSFTVDSQVGRGLISASIRPPVRDRYRSIVVNLPHPRGTPIQKVVVNGVEHRDFDPRQATIRLTQGPAEFRITAAY